MDEVNVKVKHSEIVRDTVEAALTQTRGDKRAAFLRKQAYDLAILWRKDYHKLLAHLTSELAKASVGREPSTLDLRHNLVATIPDARITVESDADRKDRDAMYRRGSNIEYASETRFSTLPSASRQTGKTYVVVAHYDDVILGEFGFVDEAQRFAALAHQACRIECYDKEYGLEWQDWTDASPHQYQSSFDTQPLTRPDRSAPERAKPKNARDETWVSSRPRTVEAAKDQIEMLQSKLAQAQADLNRLLATRK